MQIEDAINKLNRKDFFKCVAFLILSFPTFQFYGQMQGVLLALVTPNHTCYYGPANQTMSVSKDQCFLKINSSVQKCQKWNFSLEPVGTTMMSDYGLVCDKSGYKDIVLVVWYVTTITAVLMGWLSDRYGRKKIVLFNLCMETICSILVAVAPNITSNIIFRFFLGITACNVYIAFVWLIESVNIEFRRFVGSFFWMYGCIAYMILPLIVYFTRNWRYTQLVSIIPSILYLFIFFLPESPRWLFVVGKRREAMQSMDRIKKMNKLNIDLKDDDIVVVEEDDEGGVLSALRSSVFVFRIVISLFVQFSTAILYSSVTLNISILSNNVLLSIFLLGAMETPGLFLSYFCLYYIRRKVSLLGFGITGASLFWACAFLNKNVFWQSTLLIIVGCIAKAVVSSVNQTTMVYVAELFPTSHRSLSFVCLQIAGFMAFVGAIYVNKLSRVHFILPMSIYLSLVLISSISTFFLLPETKDLPFPETLSDQRKLRIGHEMEFLTYMKNKHVNGSNLSESPGENVVNDDESTALINKKGE